VTFATVLGEVPALPLHTAGKYVAGAYIVLFALVLVYVAIMAIRLSRIERDLGELLSLSEHAAESAAPAAGQDPASGSDPAVESGQRKSAPAYPMKGHT
jgi:hypothetical protein